MIITCVHCGDPADRLNHKQEPECLGCWNELACGVLPYIGGKGCCSYGPHADTTPEQDNAIRELEEACSAIDGY